MLSNSQALAGLSRPLQQDPSSERRSEIRTPCDAIPALIRTNAAPLPAQILDISLSGVRLRLNSCLAVGTDVTVSFNNTIALGNVRYCRANPDHTFDAGLRIEDVLNVV